MPSRPILGLRSPIAAAVLTLGLSVLSLPLFAPLPPVPISGCATARRLWWASRSASGRRKVGERGLVAHSATTCRSVIEGELQSRYYYIYAEDAEGVGRWAGDIDMCIAENEFKIVGVKDCFARGYQKMGFREYDTGGQGSWMVQLTEAAREGTDQP